MDKNKKFGRGRWQVERQRCRIEDNEPPAADPTAPLQELIPALIRKLEEQEPEWTVALESEWADLVPEPGNKHSRPGRIQDAQLTVFVDSSVWLSELTRYGKRNMLTALQKKFGKDKISSIKFMIDPGR